MTESFLDRLMPAPTSTPAVVTVPALTDPTRAAAYAHAALVGEVENVQAVPIGSGRNDALNRAALKMYGYAAAGAIDERTVTDTLQAADGGPHPATDRTLQSAREAAFHKYAPKALPESTVKVPPWETVSASNPFADHYIGHAVDSSADKWATQSSGPTRGPDGRSDVSSSSAVSAVTDSPSSGPNSSTEISPTIADGSSPDPLVIVEAASLRRRRAARVLIDAEDALREFRVPPYLATLTDELALPDEDVTYAIAELFPTGANVLLTAQYKTGKTTMVNNLARSFVDGEPFLGRYKVAPVDGRVALFNYEVGPGQYRRWLRDVQIVNTDRVAVLNLRGYRLPLDVKQVETWAVEWLKRAEAAVWIVDPMARAASGIDENDNGLMGAWLETLDVIKHKAGIGELILPNHTGRSELEQGAEHGRGATRVDDWADVRWLLTKDASGTRFFRASGRDVETDEQSLSFDEPTRRLSVTGGDRRSVKAERYDTAVLTCVSNVPGQGVRELQVGVRQQLTEASDHDVRNALERLIARRLIHVREVSRKHCHYPGPPVLANPFGPP